MTSEANGGNAVVVVGAGQAGITLAGSLRERGWDGAVHLVGAEDRAPYQRPPLSKGYLSGAETESDLLLGSIPAFERDAISFHPGRVAVELDRIARTVRLDDGAVLAYGTVVLATGAAPRILALPGAALPGVATLRSVADADALRTALETARHVVIVGGGFLGLEFATTAARTATVTVLEGLPRILIRAVSEPTARRLHDAHGGRGVRIRTNVGVAGFEGSDRVEAVVLADGSRVRADLVLVAVGADANADLALRSGLFVDRGVVVDDHLQTSDPHVYAIGDCAVHPNPFLGGAARLESVQNATDQARFVAREISGDGDGEPYRALPWFWSHQAGVNLQIAGLATPDDATVVVVDAGGVLVVHRERAGRVVAVETIDHPRAHVRARRELAQTLLTAP